MTDARTLLVADDDTPFRQRLVKAFVHRGFDVTGVDSAAAALAAAERESPELALVDLRLGDDSGLDLVQALKDIDATTSVVVLTGYGSIATAVESMKRGATTYLTKPVDADQILAAFDGAAPVAAASVPTLARVEWEHIQRVLAACGGNVSQASRLLGIHRRSLQRKLWKHPAPEAADDPT